MSSAVLHLFFETQSLDEPGAHRLGGHWGASELGGPPDYRCVSSSRALTRG